MALKQGLLFLEVLFLPHRYALLALPSIKKMVLTLIFLSFSLLKEVVGDLVFWLLRRFNLITLPNLEKLQADLQNTDPFFANAEVLKLAGYINLSQSIGLFVTAYLLACVIDAIVYRHAD